MTTGARAPARDCDGGTPKAEVEDAAAASRPTADLSQRVPAEALTALERHVIEAGRQARPDGTFPRAMRPWFGPPDHKRFVNGVTVPAGWPAAAPFEPRADDPDWMREGLTDTREAEPSARLREGDS